MFALDKFSRLQLAHLPTPFEPMPGLSRELNINLFIKRDDCTGLATGGNKVRKLEYLMADALACNADTVITVGAIQSNHARQTAAACAKLGLKCELGLSALDPIPSSGYGNNGNVLLDGLLGARVHHFPADSNSGTVLQALFEQAVAQGRRPYPVPIGGSNALGALGYVSAALELGEQIASNRLRNVLVIHATGSGGTQAGLLIGSRLAEVPFDVLGISVGRERERQTELVAKVAADLARLLNVDCLDSRAIRVRDAYRGRAYGQPTPEMIRALRLTSEVDAVFLDPVYSGKAMAGLFDLARCGDLLDYDTIIFLHTGGSPALFAYSELFRREEKPKIADSCSQVLSVGDAT